MSKINDETHKHEIETTRKASRIIYAVAAAIGIFVSISTSQAQTPRHDFSQLDAVVQQELKDRNTPGAAIAIVEGDRVIYTKAYGAASVETGAPVTPEMLFRLGSTTKMFTAIALVNLAAQGRIKLDEPIGNYAKGLHPNLARITTHQLISNTGGMADIEAPVSQDDEALAKMVRGWNDSVRFAEPGQIYSYSSAGFWLSGFLIEEITKKPYADAMAELVFQPLGMDRTTLRPLVAITYPLAMGHSVSGKELAKVIRPAYNNVAQWPAGSIYSNIGELSRFVIAMLNSGKVDGKQAIPADVVAKMHGKYTPMPGDPDAGYGYGLLNFPYRGVRVLMHGGFSRGYGSMIQMMPDQKWGVIVVSNRSGETMPRSRNKAIEMFVKLNPETPEPAKAAMPLSSEDMARFAGKYVNGTQTWEVVIKDGKLIYKQPDGDLALSKTAANRLSFGSSLENDLIFMAGQNGEMDYVFDGLYSAKKAR